MQEQFYAIGLDSDQRDDVGGIFCRQRGSLSAMRAFSGHPVGSSKRFYSESEYEIRLEYREGYIDDQGVDEPGAIYALVEL